MIMAPNSGPNNGANIAALAMIAINRIASISSNIS